MSSKPPAARRTCPATSRALVQAAAETKLTANRLLQASDELSGQAAALRSEVEEFLAAIKAA